MTTDPAQVFVLGLDEHNRDVLDDIEHLEQYEFHGVLDIARLQQGDEIPVRELLDEAEQEIRDHPAQPDAVIGWWDFPVSLMVPVLSRRLGLRSASLESLLRCEHKYWSRLVQSEVTDCHPDFAVLDPHDPDQEPPLRFPFWLKPVKSFASELAFLVEDHDQFRQALEELREGIHRIGDPFEHFLSLAEVPPQIRDIGGTSCIAEAVMTGAQCTVEGWVDNGTIEVHGIVDSVHYPDSPSFQRFELPSTMPEEAQARMVDATRKVIKHTALDGCTFNVEYFYDQGTGRVGLLEVNPRHSQSHAPLFDAVHGIVTHQISVDLALGHRPQLPRESGAHGVAAKYFFRCTRAGTVTREPTAAEIAFVEGTSPATDVEITAHEGDRLCELHDQDAYSYKLAEIYVAAPDRDTLVDRCRRCVQDLPFEIDGVPAEPDAASTPLAEH